MRASVGVLGVLLTAAPAYAHVGVTPRESKPRATETYTLRVPSEGGKATTGVTMGVPDGVTVVSVSAPAEATHSEKRSGDRVVEVAWTVAIAAGASAQLSFVAKNPPTGDAIVWQVHQKYADGTASDWVGAAGTRAPAPVTRLISAVASQSPETAPAQAVADFFARYDQAFVAKDLDRLAAMYHPDVTIFEGGGVNTGWADYRDNHIGPELKSFNGLKFSHSNIKVQMLSPDAAYVTSEYSIEVTGANGPTRSGGLETDVLLRQNGAWVIRHTHTSARRQRPAGQQD